jgi:hypothetical protein
MWENVVREGWKHRRRNNLCWPTAGGGGSTVPCAVARVKPAGARRNYEQKKGEEEDKAYEG